MRVDAEGAIPPHQPNCLGCGPDNEAGLNMRMRVDGDRVRAEIVLDRRHEGAPGIAHGGAVATAMDDLFGGVLVMLRRPAVTVNLNVDFRAPVLLGERLELAAWCDHVHDRKLMFRGEVRARGEVVAEATAVFLSVDIEHFERSGAPLPDAWRSWAA